MRIMKKSRSKFLYIRGLKYHIREWGHPNSPKIIFLHGWMDMSASFQFTVDCMADDWHVLAPDWRGFGLSEWAKTDYWFQDYIADLNTIIDKLSPKKSVIVVGHSMGGNVAAILAGTRPNRFRKLILAEGFGLRPRDPEKAPRQYSKWLKCINYPKTLKPYNTFKDVADRLLNNTPNMELSKAEFLAVHWAKKTKKNLVELRADPKHRNPSPSIYHPEEAMACWRKITAPVLWVHSDSDWLQSFMGDHYDKVESYRKAFKLLSEVKINNSSHMMHLDQPLLFAQAIEKFIK